MARDFLTAVAVKRGLSRFSAIQMPPECARIMIEYGAGAGRQKPNQGSDDGVNPVLAACIRPSDLYSFPPFDLKNIEITRHDCVGKHSARLGGHISLAIAPRNVSQD